MSPAPGGMPPGGSRPGPGGPAILILAAGGSTRMRGRDKLLEEVRGRPLIADRVAVACRALALTADLPAHTRTSAEPAVFVTLPPRAVAEGRWRALARTPARVIEVADHGAGMAASLRAGVAALPRDCPGVVVLPADMPDLTADDLVALLARFDGDTILRGARAADGRPGHPVLFPARDFAALSALSGDRGGRELLKAEAARVRLVALPGDHALTDLDTPEDWTRWRGVDR